MKTIVFILTGILFSLSFPRPGFFSVAWFSFVPVFFLLYNASKKQAFYLGFVFGLSFFLWTIRWLAWVTFAGYILLCIYLAFYFAVFTFIFKFLSEAKIPFPLFFISVPSLWVLLEKVRDTTLFGGFGWAQVAYSQAPFLPIIQIASLTGTAGINFLIIACNFAVALLLRSAFYKDIKIKNVAFSTFFSFFLFVLVFTYGYISLKKEIKKGEVLRVGAIQGNIPQEQKWDPSARELILEKYSLLTKLASFDLPDCIIWPEAATPGFYNQDFIWEKIEQLAQDTKSWLLIGTLRQTDTLTYNSAILVNPDAQITSYYDKIHLVPFGEYLPGEKIFPIFRKIIPHGQIIGNFTKGKDIKIMHIGKRDEPQGSIPAGVFICFENTNSSLVSKFVKKGAMLLINITNEAWFRDSGQQYQHAQMSVFRAIENRRPVLRVANTGLTCLIDEQGKIVKELSDEKGKQIDVTGIMIADIHIPEKQTLTFYTMYGNVFVWFCTTMVFLTAFTSVCYNNKSR